MLVMTLCGFIKGKGQSLCQRACKNGEERRGSNNSWKAAASVRDESQGVLGRWGNSSRAEKQKPEVTPGFGSRAHSPFTLDV